MSRPPMKALEQIKAYCERTQCRRCVFGNAQDEYQYLSCKLMETAPCDWDLAEEGET